MLQLSHDAKMLAGILSLKVTSGPVVFNNRIQSCRQPMQQRSKRAKNKTSLVFLMVDGREDRGQ